MSSPAFPTKPGMPAFQGTQVAGDVVPFPGPSLFEAATRKMGGTVIKNPPLSTEGMRQGLQDLIDANRISITPNK